MIRGLLAPRTAVSPTWWRVFLAGAALALAAPLVRRAPGMPGGDAAWTVAYGVAATVLLVVALVYGARRRMPRRGPGALHHWLQAHVYGGVLFLFLLAAHAGAAAPAGALPWALWASSLWVVGTGLAGVFIQKWIPPALTSALSTEVHYDRIPELVESVRGRVERLAAACGEAVRKYHAADLAPALVRPRVSSLYFFDVTGGVESRLRRIDYLRRLSDEDDARCLEEMRGLVRAKFEMDAHYTLQKALRWWPYLHVPPVVVLAALVAFHVFAVLYY